MRSVLLFFRYTRLLMPDDKACMVDEEGARKSEMELKPVVKYIGIGVLLSAALGVNYFSFRSGYEQGSREGYEEAMEHGKAALLVSERINKVAVDNLTHFLQVDSADDAVLLKMAENREKTFEWIKDLSVRREAEWMLASHMLKRGMVSEAAEHLLAPLFAQAPQEIVWAVRAEEVACRMAERPETRELALAYYRMAEGRYAAAGRPDDRLRALNAMVAQVAYAGMDLGKIRADLEALLEDARGAGAGSEALQANILCYLSSTCRNMGDSAAAERYADEALRLRVIPEHPTAFDASAMVCLSEIFIRRQEWDKAQQYLSSAISLLDQHPELSVSLSHALCRQASVLTEKNKTEEAFTLLCRAEGVALGHVDPRSRFWACLYDQRGWLNLAHFSYEAALADFLTALRHADGALAWQSLEGAGRCCLRLNRTQEAEEYLERCLKQRREHAPRDVCSLGRVCLLLAELNDLLQKPERAASFYGEASQRFEEATEEHDVRNRLTALMGEAYVRMQLRQWERALLLWEKLLPLLAEDSERKQEVLRQISLCKSAEPSSSSPEVMPPHDEASFDSATPSPTSARRTGRASSTHRQRRY